ncbi:helix-turn-helix domain-containing protein [Vibrio ziniensis]|uniref:Helix-turn-helix domain-containing protein n=1 Tax=Vibrio ziniensis TaxID=2711221 RepID=A0A6G7CPN6_9VIBR|nr:XRE family transcriptional regulator [Vibrio ziniensis]QIH44111.1 helix-turn-helix domain-containing protein [Vibrio ziniensis]
MDDTIFKTQIASYLRSLRTDKGLSLDAASKLTGVSKAMLGQIERGESSPTISTLWKIASGLETSFSAFFADEPQLRSSELTFPDDHKMKVNTLFPYREDAGFEMFEITLTDQHKQMSEAHDVGVIEHVHVLNGDLNLYFEGQWHRLLQGQNIRFMADQPHGYQAVAEKTVFQNIVSYPRRS